MSPGEAPLRVRRAMLSAKEVPAKKTKVGAHNVRCPPGEEVRGWQRVAVRPHRVGHQAAGVEGVACMVQRHEHHHQPAKPVDGDETALWNQRFSLRHRNLLQRGAGDSPTARPRWGAAPERNFNAWVAAYPRGGPLRRGVGPVDASAFEDALRPLPRTRAVWLLPAGLRRAALRCCQQLFLGGDDVGSLAHRLVLGGRHHGAAQPSDGGAARTLQPRAV